MVAAEKYPIPLPTPMMVDSTDGVSLAVYDFGGHGPDIIFAHATGFCAGVFLPIIRRLDVGRIVAIDFRGHGRSSAPQTTMDWSGTASDIHKTIGALGLNRPFGVGHSMGGAALVLAEQAVPGSFSGMWLFEPIIFPVELRSGTGGNPLSIGALRRRRTFDSAQSAFENFAAKAPLRELDPEALRAYVRDGFSENSDGSVTLRCSPELESATYDNGDRHDAFDHLSKVTIPVTILRGAEAPMTPSQLAPIIADHLPAGVLDDHPELGHFGPLQDPTTMAESIRFAVTATA